MRKFAPRELWSHELAMARIANQKSWEEYKALSDVVLDNSGDLAHLQEQLALAWKTLQE